MYKLISLVSGNEVLNEYASSEDLEQPYKKYDLDGLEIICCGNDDRKIIRKEEIIGVHLPFYANWMDFWTENYKELEDEFLKEEVWQEFYGGKDRLTIIQFFKEALDYADSVSAKYVVFHVSNVTTKEVFSRQYKYSDEEVIDASAELINGLLDNSNYKFDFLMENLNWSGLTFIRPEITTRLLKKVNYLNKGLLLDVGHLMCTNIDLKSEAEGYDYINKMLDLHGEMVSYIKGVHLHYSITGEYAKGVLQSPPELKSDFYERFEQSYYHVKRIDTHSVTTNNKATELIRRINPKYLTLEFSADYRKSREQKLEEQVTVLP